MKMKHLIIMLFIMFMCGCTNVSQLSIDDCLNELNNPTKASNIFHTGYKYYLPDGMQVGNYINYNDVIEDSQYKYYLYVDMIAYYNKVVNTYEESTTSYYSKLININDKTGYLEINLMENSQYLIEIVYNYAKIEVMVDEVNINSVLTKAVSILKSIKYNDNVIDSLVGSNSANYQEENYNIFNTTSKDSNYLKYIDEIEEDETDYTEVEDSDLIG